MSVDIDLFKRSLTQTYVMLLKLYVSVSEPSALVISALVLSKVIRSRVTIVTDSHFPRSVFLYSYAYLIF
jgi:hypothetical protein